MPLTVCKWSARGNGEELECGAERRSGEARETEIQSTKKENGVGGVSIPLTIHLRGNPTNFPPFPTWNAKTVAPTWCRKHNSRSLPLDASRRDAMIRRARSSIGIQSVQGWDNEETKLNFARDGKFYFQFKKKNSSGFNFPRKEISQQTIYFNSNVG